MNDDIVDAVTTDTVEDTVSARRVRRWSAGAALVSAALYAAVSAVTTAPVIEVALVAVAVTGLACSVTIGRLDLDLDTF